MYVFFFNLLNTDVELTMCQALFFHFTNTDTFDVHNIPVRSIGTFIWLYSCDKDIDAQGLGLHR